MTTLKKVKNLLCDCVTVSHTAFAIVYYEIEKEKLKEQAQKKKWQEESDLTNSSEEPPFNFKGEKTDHKQINAIRSNQAENIKVSKERKTISISDNRSKYGKEIDESKTMRKFGAIHRSQGSCCSVRTPMLWVRCFHYQLIFEQRHQKCLEWYTSLQNFKR